MTSPSSMHETEHSKPVYWDNPEGWDGEGGWKRVFAMTNAFSWKTLLAFALLHFALKAKLTCYSRYLLTSYFGIPVPYDEKDFFFLVSVGAYQADERAGVARLCWRESADEPAGVARLSWRVSGR